MYTCHIPLPYIAVATCLGFRSIALSTVARQSIRAFADPARKVPGEDSAVLADEIYGEVSRCLVRERFVPVCRYEAICMGIGGVFGANFLYI